MLKQQVSITFKEFLRLMFKLTYSKPTMIVILIVDLLMICWITLSLNHLQGIPPVTFFQFSTVVLITVIQPSFIYITIRGVYRSSTHLTEKMDIEFTPSQVRVTGESFYTEHAWSNMFKVIEWERWFLLYQNSLSAILINKKYFSPKEIEELSILLKAIPELKVRLKKKNVVE